MSKDDEGHKYTFHIPWVPWHEQTDEQKGLDVIDNLSKAYLDEVRELLMQIMSDRHNPRRVWDRASRALRLIDTEGQGG